MIIVGIDEVGRGCLVGNVVAGAVILDANFIQHLQSLGLPALTDSKKISAKNREILYAQITQKCQWAVGEADAGEIDEINILQATMLAMKRAAQNLATPYQQVLVDGNRCPELENCVAIIKGDLSEPAISAASIIAKVTRDRQMLALDKRYPQYGFAGHKGYATKQHLQALKDFGVIEKQHRFSFAPVKNLSHHQGLIL